MLKKWTLCFALTTATLFTASVRAEKPVEYKFHINAAQYKNADYSHAVRFERGLSLEEAQEIANSDPNIDYFFRIKGRCMVLETEESISQQELRLGLGGHTDYIYDSSEPGSGYARVFYHGDTVFFSGKDKMWLGSAPGLADTFEKL